jgi:hypothetical protein
VLGKHLVKIVIGLLVRLLKLLLLGLRASLTLSS